MKFAKDTEVPVERTKAEIESVVARYGASGYMGGWLGDRAMVTFEVSGRRVRFNLPLPSKESHEVTHKPAPRVNQHDEEGREVKRSPEEAARFWDQACRQKWRALLLVIKAKLEAVMSGITTFDEEFMPHIVMANGKTVAEQLLPQFAKVLESGKMPPLLPAGGEP